MQEKLLRKNGKLLLDILLRKRETFSLTMVDCSGNLNSTKSTDGSAGTLTALTAGSEEDSTVEIYASSRSRRCQ